MAELRIRNLDEWVSSWLKSQAKLHGRTLEKELRELLTETARTQKQQVAQELLENLTDLEEKYGQFPEGTLGIREARETRG